MVSKAKNKQDGVTHFESEFDRSTCGVGHTSNEYLSDSVQGRDISLRTVLNPQRTCQDWAHQHSIAMAAYSQRTILSPESSPL